MPTEPLASEAFCLFRLVAHIARNAWSVACSWWLRRWERIAGACKVERVMITDVGKRALEGW